MIPINLYIVLVVVEIILVLYSIIDTRNKYYANIATAFIASILGVFLAVTISTGVVMYDPTIVTNSSYQWVNTSTYDSRLQETVWTNTSTFTATCASCETPIVDQSVGFMIMILSIFMMIYSALMVYDAYLEWKMANKEDGDL